VQPNLAQIVAKLFSAEANAAQEDTPFTNLADDSETGTGVQATEFKIDL
jgi:hypothetical protein